jgi:SAM-dependent methyltransferase
MARSPAQKTDSASIFNRTHARHRREKAARSFDDFRFLHDRVCDTLNDRLRDIQRTFTNVLVIGHAPRKGEFDEILSTATITQTDLASNVLQPTRFRAVQSAEDMLPFQNQSFDLVYNALSLHQVNDLPGALIQIKRVLKPDGLFLGCMFGGETLFEMRSALTQAEMTQYGGVSPRVHPFADKPQTGELLQRAGFALPVVDSDIVTATYPHFFALTRDIKGMGESNIINNRRETFTGRTFFEKAARLYHAGFAEEDGRIPAKFEMIYMHGWAPHESQQQPLRRGSAENRLADVLQTEEIKTGIKTP